MNDEYGHAEKNFAGGLISGSPDFSANRTNGSPENNFNANAGEDFAGSGDSATPVQKIQIRNGKKPNEWKMPEPVFRASSGKKIEKFVEGAQNDSSPNKPEVSENAFDAKAKSSNAEVKSGVNETIEKSPVQAERESSGAQFVFSRLAVIIVFAAALLIAVYFLLFYKNTS